MGDPLVLLTWTPLAGSSAPSHPSTGLVGWSLLVVAITVHLLVHEGGHALAGSACRLRTERFVIGTGPRLVRLDIGRSNVDFHLLPLGGHVILGMEHPDDPPTRIRSRLLLTYAAGPIATLLLAIFGGSFTLSVITTVGDEPGPWSIWFAILLERIGWIAFVANVLPWPRNTDGAQLLALLRSNGPALAVRADGLAAGAVNRLIAEGRHDDAADLFGDHITNRSARFAKFAALTLAERFDEALAGWLELARLDHPENGEVTVWNGLTWSAVNLGGDHNLVLADEYSQRCIDRTPPGNAARPVVSSTRGRVLLELGRPEEALSFLDEAAMIRDDRRALVLAARSLAKSALGDALGAVRDASRAAQRRGDHPYVRRAHRLVGLESVALLATLARGVDPAGERPSSALGRRDMTPLIAAARTSIRRFPDDARALLAAKWPTENPEETMACVLKLLGLPMAVASTS